MSLFTRELAMDLGTANTLIIYNDKVVVDEPSIVAIDQRTGKVIAIGKEARQMLGRAHDNIRTIRPLKDGVIADYTAAEMMIRGMIRLIKFGSSLFTPSLKMVICIPSGSTNVDIRTVRDSAENSGGREVYMIYEPMAAAIGIGLDVMAPQGQMVVDIGGGTTEAAVISLGGIVCSDTVKIAGDALSEDIKNYMKTQYNVKVGDRTAEEIKINVGCVVENMELAPYSLKGADVSTALPVSIDVTSHDTFEAIDKSIMKIEMMLHQVLERTPPELYTDIVTNGIYLAGGGAQMNGLDKRLEERLKIKFHVAEEALTAVARGTGKVLKNTDKYMSLLIK